MAFNCFPGYCIQCNWNGWNWAEILSINRDLVVVVILI